MSSAPFIAIETGPEPSDQVLDQIRSGIRNTCFLLRGLFDLDRLRTLKAALHERGRTEPARRIRYYEGCPNHHKIAEADMDSGRPEYRRLYQQFPWNPNDMADVFEVGHRLVALRNRIARLDPNMGLDISRGYFTTFTVAHYPSGGGFLGPHADDHEQGLEVILLLSQRGEDYQEGGLFFMDEDQRHQFVDSHTRFGDLIVVRSDTIHGIHPIDPARPRDLSSPAGRWMLFTPMVKASILAPPPSERNAA